MPGFGPPRCSVKLGPRQAAWAEWSQDWRGRPQVRFRVADLPSGLLTPSPVEPNIKDVGALKTLLRALIGLPASPSRSPRPISLVLPDLCVRTLLLTVETPPSRPRELDALIRWRLGKEAAFPVAGARIVSQVAGRSTVLAAMAGESVLRQYETVCDELGLAPVHMEPAGFALARLARALSPGDEPTGCLSLLDDGFTLMILHAGRPVFVRTKIHAPQVLADLAASLALYEESYPDAALRRLHVIGEGEGEGMEPDLATTLSRELDLEVVGMGGADLRRVWRAPLSNSLPSAAVPAVAALAPGRPSDALRLNFSRSRHAVLRRASAALAAVSLLLIGVIVWDLWEARALQAQAAVVERALARVQEQDRRVQHQAQTEGMDLSDGAMGKLSGDVVFANELIAQRVFSWTRFLSDLEDAVPTGVSIKHIRLDSKGAAVTIGGSALSLKDLAAFVISLEDHRAFADANLLEHRVQETNVVDFSVTAHYQPQENRL